jgi:hypothetical protein
MKCYTETEQCEIKVGMLEKYHNDEITRIQIKPRYMKNTRGVSAVTIYVHQNGKIETRLWLRGSPVEPIVTEIVPP